MLYAKGLILSTTVALLATGCVKPTEQVNTTGTSTTTGTAVYSDGTTNGSYTPVYEDTSTIVYEDVTTTGSGTVYGDTVTTGTTITDGTVVTTSGYDTSVVGTQVSGNGAYGNPYGGTTSTSSTVYTSNDPYTTTSSSTTTYNGGYDDPYSTTSSSVAPDYTANTSYSTGSSSHGGGVQLQVAALRSYASAEEFKNGLSLDPKYSAYVKRGAMNKVIITGISSRAEAKRLATTRFPGAFIVSGSSSGYSASSSSSYGSSSHSGSSSSATGNGIGVQVGAFSSKSSASAAAQSAAGSRYTGVVKTATVRGRTIYKAIVLGFSSASDARSAIASGKFGNAFLVTGIR